MAPHTAPPCPAVGVCLPSVHARRRAGPQPDGRRHGHPARYVGGAGAGGIGLGRMTRERSETGEAWQATCVRLTACPPPSPPLSSASFQTWTSTLRSTGRQRTAATAWVKPGQSRWGGALGGGHGAVAGGVRMRILSLACPSPPHLQGQRLDSTRSVYLPRSLLPARLPAPPNPQPPTPANPRTVCRCTA